MQFELGLQGQHPTRRSTGRLPLSQLAAVAGLAVLSILFVVLAVLMVYGHYTYGHPWRLSIGSLAMAIILFPATPLSWQWRGVLPLVVTALLL